MSSHTSVAKAADQWRAELAERRRQRACVATTQGHENSRVLLEEAEELEERDQKGLAPQLSLTASKRRTELGPLPREDLRQPPLGPLLKQALLRVAQARPSDPARFLGQLLSDPATLLRSNKDGAENTAPVVVAGVTTAAYMAQQVKPLLQASLRSLDRVRPRPADLAEFLARILLEQEEGSHSSELDRVGEAGVRLNASGHSLASEEEEVAAMAAEEAADAETAMLLRLNEQDSPE